MAILGIRIHSVGGPEVLTFESFELSEPGPGEVRLRIRAAGVNFIDTYHRSGLYPVPSLPAGIGVEAAGVVEALGSGVSNVRVGDRVAFGGGRFGAYAEACNVPADRLVPIPEGVDDETAAAALMQGMTAEYLVDRCAKVRAGDTVLVHAAAGGTGQWLVAWLRDRGAHAIGIVGTRAKVAVAKSAGASEVVVRDEEDVVARVRAITANAGVSVVFDSVGRDTLGLSLTCIARRGLLVSFGNASGPPDPLDLLELSRRGSLYVTRPTLADYVASRAELELSSHAVFDRLARKVLVPRIDARLPLASAREAHARIEGRGTLGKILLVP